VSTNNPDDRPIRPVFVLTVNGAVIVIFSDGQQPTASLAAHSAVTVFQVAFARWVSTEEPPSLAACIAETGAALRALK
jgi:hypothetical protein